MSDGKLAKLIRPHQRHIKTAVPLEGCVATLWWPPWRGLGSWRPALRRRGSRALRTLGGASIRESASAAISGGRWRSPNRFPMEETGRRDAFHLRSNPLQKRSVRLIPQVRDISSINRRPRSHGEQHGGLGGEASLAAGAVSFAGTCSLETTPPQGRPNPGREPRT